MRVKCLAQEHNTMTRPGLEPEPFDPESSALTAVRPSRLPVCYIMLCYKTLTQLPGEQSVHRSFPLALNVPRGHGSSESNVRFLLLQYPAATRIVTKSVVPHDIGSFTIPESELTGFLEEVNAFCYYNYLVSVSFPRIFPTIF